MEQTSMISPFIACHREYDQSEYRKAAVNSRISHPNLIEILSVFYPEISFSLSFITKWLKCTLIR